MTKDDSSFKFEKLKFDFLVIWSFILDWQKLVPSLQLVSKAWMLFFCFRIHWWEELWSVQLCDTAVPCLCVVWEDNIQESPSAKNIKNVFDGHAGNLVTSVWSISRKCHQNFFFFNLFFFGAGTEPRALRMLVKRCITKLHPSPSPELFNMNSCFITTLCKLRLA
jgi:hypothetical protein